MPLGNWFRPNWKHSEPSVRKAAVERLDDKAVLADIAMHDEHPGVRQAAVHRLDDEAVLAEIAVHDEHPGVRQAAVQRLDDEAVLADVAMHDEHPGVRETAVERLEDPAALAEVAMQNDDPAVREAAVERLADAVVLADIAVHDADPGVRQAAIDRLMSACAETAAPGEAPGAQSELGAPSTGAARDALIDLVLADPTQEGLMSLIAESGFHHSDPDRQLLFLTLAGRFDDCLAVDPGLERLQVHYMAASSELQRRIQDAIRRASDPRLAALFVTQREPGAPPEVRADLSAEEADLLVDLHARSGGWDQVPQYLEVLPPHAAFGALLSIIARAPLDSTAFGQAVAELGLAADQYPQGPFMSALFSNTNGYRSQALAVLKGAEVERFSGLADPTLLYGLALLFLQAGLADDNDPVADWLHDAALQLLVSSCSADSAALGTALAEFQLVCQQNGCYRAAVRYAAPRYELAPTDTATACDLARAYADCGQPEHGYEVLKALIEGKPFVGVAPYQLTTDLLCLLGLEDAQQSVESALERFQLAQKFARDAYVLYGASEWYSQKDAEIKALIAQVTGAAG
jgi:tetratricopeptide (TPR) repeat protein